MLVQEGAVAGDTPPEADGAERRVFAVLGVRPEPGGYAVAKFSRSARPYEEWAAELTEAGEERFYEQFYFQYGHASIADLAHLTMVVENVSIVAAIELLDEPLVDAQESSTRYQDFTRRRYYTPPEIADSPRKLAKNSREPSGHHLGAALESLGNPSSCDPGPVVSGPVRRRSPRPSAPTE